MLRIVQNIHVETAYDGLSQSALSFTSCEPARTYTKVHECSKRACAACSRERHVLANRRVDLAIQEDATNQLVPVELLRMRRARSRQFQWKISSYRSSVSRAIAFWTRCNIS